MHGRRARAASLATAYLASLLAIVFALAACGGSNVPTAQQLIKNAQAAIQKVKSYHFNLVVDNPGEGGVLTIKSADGDVLVLDKLQAKATPRVFGNAVNVPIFALATTPY